MCVVFFPGCKKPERVKVLEMIQPAVSRCPEVDSFAEAMDNLDLR